MKYIIFAAALCCVLPAAFLLAAERRLLRWSILGLILPLLMYQQTSINFFSHELYRGTARGMEVSVIYLAAAAILTALVLRRGFQSPVPGAGAWIYLGYFLLSLPSLLTAENTLFSFFEVWKMVMIYLVYLAVYYYLEYQKGDCRILLLGFGAALLLIFFSVVRQHFSGVYQVRAQFPHQNSLAMFAGLLGTLFFSMCLNSGENRSRLLGFSGFALASVILFRTYSRGAIVCYPLACGLTAAVSLMYDWKMRKLQFLAVLGVIALGVVLLFVPRLIERFESAPESSGQTRINFAIAARNMIMDEPFFGVGLNNWGIKINPPYEYSEHRDPSKGFTDDYKDGIVETIYLLVCAECGIPCFLMLLLFFFCHWAAALKLSGRLRKTPYFFIPAGLIGGFTMIYLQSVLEWVLKQQVNFLELMIFFAVIDYMNRHWRELKAASLQPLEYRRLAA